MVRGIVFDIGGVLSYDIQEYVFGDKEIGVVATYGLNKDEVSEITKSLFDKYAHTTISHAHRWKDLENEFWDEFKLKSGLTIPNSVFTDLTHTFIRPVPGMMDLVKDLKDSGMDLLICSNNTEFFYQRINQLLHLEDYFEKRKIILSNHHGVSKSHNTFTLFKEVEKQMDYPKEEYLFIDDRKGNIEQSLKFGLPAIFFPAEAAYGSTYLKEILKKINGE